MILKSGFKALAKSLITLFCQKTKNLWVWNGILGLNENKGVSYHEAISLPLQRKENKGKLKMKLLVQQQQQGEGTLLFLWAQGSWASLCLPHPVSHQQPPVLLGFQERHRHINLADCQGSLCRKCPSGVTTSAAFPEKRQEAGKTISFPLLGNNMNLKSLLINKKPYVPILVCVLSK